jgi:WhiB family redox-sensing transcriptional regulator
MGRGFKTVNTPDWRERSLCAQPYYLKYREHFFSDEADKIAEAKEVCFLCPVRKQCLKSALNTKEVWGVWGGKDQEEIRNTLSINEDGQEVRRSKDGIAPVCLSCDAPTESLVVDEVDAEGGGRWTTKKIITCSECMFNWTSRTSANAIESYLSMRTRNSRAE